MIDRLIKDSPEKFFMLFVGVHMICWTLLPAIVNPNLPYDVIEGLAWGHEWQWGYYKHPPVKPWLLETSAILSGNHDWGMYLLSQVCVAVAFLAIWRLGRDLLDRRWALIAVLLLEGIYYHNYTSPEFNVNVAQLPFWAMTLLFVWRALSRGAIHWWLLAGVCVGIGFLAKYLFLFLVVPIIIMLFSVKTFRAALKTPGPWLAGAIALAIVAPHLWWLVENNFPTITYGMAMADPGSRSAINHLFYPLRFLVSQSLILIPVFIMLWTLRKRPDAPVETAVRPPDATRYLLFTVLGPALLMALISLVFGWKIRSMWATPLFLASGVALVYFLRNRLSTDHMKGFVRAFAIFFCLSLVAYFAVASVGPRFTKRAKRTHFPGTALAAAVTERWHARIHSPLEIIIGSYWKAGNVAFYAPHRASIFIDGDPKKSPWITPEQIRKEGAVVIGHNKTDAYNLVPEYAAKVIDEGPIQLAPAIGVDLPPMSFWMLIIPPEKG